MASQLDLVKEANLSIASVQPRLHSLYPDAPRPAPEDPSARMELLKKTIARFASCECAAQTPFVTISGAAPQGNFRSA